MGGVGCVGLAWGGPWGGSHGGGVPFELGRPFGAPADAGLQTRVLRAALALLDQPGPGPILEDFTEEAPYLQGEEGWEFPGELDTDDVLAEVASVRPFWEQARDRHGRSRSGDKKFRAKGNYG